MNQGTNYEPLEVGSEVYKDESSTSVLVLTAVLITLSMIITFLIQFVFALLLWPLLLWSTTTAGWFYAVQLTVYMRLYDLLVVRINPFWTVRVHKVTSDVPIPSSAIIFCNHRSNSDPWMLCNALMQCGGVTAVFPFKEVLRKLPIAGWSLMLGGHIPVFRGVAGTVESVMETARTRLEQGFPLTVFPEGTRSTNGLLLPFKDGFFRLAHENGNPVVPLLMVNSNIAWQPASTKMAVATVHVVIGDPINPKEFDTPAELLAHVRAEIIGLQDFLPYGAVPEWDPLVTKKPYPWFNEALQKSSEKSKKSGLLAVCC